MCVHAHARACVCVHAHTWSYTGILQLSDDEFSPIHIHPCTHHTHVYRSDCEHFGLPPPEFPLLEELQTDLTRYENMWSLYGEFSSGMEQLCKEDWISFRLAS